jgi:hypothetical protein
MAWSGGAAVPSQENQDDNEGEDPSEQCCTSLGHESTVPESVSQMDCLGDSYD